MKNVGRRSLRKRIVVLIAACMLLISVLAAGQSKEDYSSVEIGTCRSIISMETIGDFRYEFFNGISVATKSSMLVSLEDNTRGIFIGFKEKVTQAVITNNMYIFSLKGFTASSNHSKHNSSEKVTFSGYLFGMLVTEEVVLTVDKFLPTGDYYDLSKYEGFDRIDEIRISGTDIQMTVESIDYTNGKFNLLALNENN